MFICTEILLILTNYRVYLSTTLLSSLLQVLIKINWKLFILCVIKREPKTIKYMNTYTHTFMEIIKCLSMRMCVFLFCGLVRIHKVLT